MFTLGVAQMGALYSGFITNPQDIAPNFAGDKELKLKLKNQFNQFRNCTWANQLYWVYPWVCCSYSGKLYHQWRRQQHCQVEECLDHHHCHPHGWDCHLHHLCWWKAAEVECSNWWKGQRRKKGLDFGKSSNFSSNKLNIYFRYFSLLVLPWLELSMSAQWWLYIVSMEGGGLYLRTMWWPDINTFTWTWEYLFKLGLTR